MANQKIKLAIVGVGKIVNDQHLPSIAKDGAYELVATASRNGRVDGVTAYKDVLLEKPPGATVCEVEQLATLAEKNDCRLYTTWHSRHGAAVEQAREFLSADD